MDFAGETINKLGISEVGGYRFTVYAGKGMRLEGHRGIYEISDTVLRFRIKKGAVVVTGRELKIKEISDSEVYIIGIIEGISL
jgi:sporulation protein YqfC